MTNFEINTAQKGDIQFAEFISQQYRLSSLKRGTGIALRTKEYIEEKMMGGNAIVAKYSQQLAGFCYIETFSKGSYVSNSGLIVMEEFRSKGLGKSIKNAAFQLARKKYPKAKVFGITTNSSVMKINAGLGYIPVSFQQLTDDEEFWNGCQSCPNYDILQRNNHTNCLCTAMLAPSQEESMKFELSHLLINQKS